MLNACCCTKVCTDGVVYPHLWHGTGSLIMEQWLRPPSDCVIFSQIFCVCFLVKMELIHVKSACNSRGNPVFQKGLRNRG
jgi:hypothetical protein